MKSRALGQPASDERSLVGAVVIHDEMDRQGGGDSGIDRVEELSELKRTMPPVELAEDLAGLEIEGRKQRGRAVAFVVVGPTLDLARAHWQQRLRPIERLNRRLLVHAEHDRMLGRIHVPLSANMSETVTPGKFRVEGEAGSESDERIGAGPRWAGDRGGGEGDAAAVHGGVQAEDRPRGGRL